MHSLRSALVLGAAMALSASLMACSALTRPDEITISAEPLGAPPTPPPAPAPPPEGAAQPQGG